MKKCLVLCLVFTFFSAYGQKSGYFQYKSFNGDSLIRSLNIPLDSLQNIDGDGFHFEWSDSLLNSMDTASFYQGIPDIFNQFFRFDDSIGGFSSPFSNDFFGSPFGNDFFGLDGNSMFNDMFLNFQRMFENLTPLEQTPEVPEQEEKGKEKPKKQEEQPLKTIRI